MSEKKYTLNQILTIVRANCVMCDNGISHIEGGTTYDISGNIESEQPQPIECEYCGRMVRGIKHTLKDDK